VTNTCQLARLRGRPFSGSASPVATRLSRHRTWSSADRTASRASSPVT